MASVETELVGAKKERDGAVHQVEMLKSRVEGVWEEATVVRGERDVARVVVVALSEHLGVVVAERNEARKEAARKLI